MATNVRDVMPPGWPDGPASPQPWKPLPTHLHTTIDSIIRSVAELPDRTSPEHDPTQMTVTESELRDILWRHLDHFA